jgi:hypothetical protein
MALCVIEAFELADFVFLLFGFTDVFPRHAVLAGQRFVYARCLTASSARCVWFLHLLSTYFHLNYLLPSLLLSVPLSRSFLFFAFSFLVYLSSYLSDAFLGVNAILLSFERNAELASRVTLQPATSLTSVASGYATLGWLLAT